MTTLSHLVTAEHNDCIVFSLAVASVKHKTAHPLALCSTSVSSHSLLHSVVPFHHQFLYFYNYCSDDFYFLICILCGKYGVVLFPVTEFGLCG